MHDPEVVRDVDPRELNRLLGRLSSLEGRREAVKELARLLGGAELLLFAPDPELDVMLPAPGLSQMLPGADQWRALVGRCLEEGFCEGELPGPDGSNRRVIGCAHPGGAVALLLDPESEAPGVAPLQPILPLLGALFVAERGNVALQARARSALETAQRAKTLTESLQQMRLRLEAALSEAEAARNENRLRAEQAEQLSEELRVQAEQLEQQAVELEMMNEQLSERTEEAIEAQLAADKANQAKSDFLASMSHELRTPINAVLGYVDLLNLGISGPVTPKQQAQLERIRASSAHLLTLIDDVLDLSKVEAGTLTVALERESASLVVREAMALVEVQAAANGLVLNVDLGDGDVEYIGDRDRVRQILVNLLTNAVKFTDSGGRIAVEVGRASDTAGPGPGEPDWQGKAGGRGWIYFSVEDTGEGIPPDALVKIFDPFVQVETGHTRTRGGTGLGLTISRRLARLMGGELSVTSRVGIGSRFVLTMPAVAAIHMGSA